MIPGALLASGFFLRCRMGFLSSIGKLAKGITGGDLLSAGVSLLGSGLDYSGARSANSAAMASTQEQMDFQREMRATSHQTQVADLRKAGLNPVLSAGGNGASVPSGASFAPENELSSAKDAGLRSAQMTSMRLQNDLTRAQTAKTVQEARATAASADKAEVMKAPFSAIARSVPSIKSTAKDMAKFYTTSDHPLSPGALINDIVSKFSSSGSDVKNFPKIKIPALPDGKSIFDLPVVTVHPKKGSR